MAYLTQSSILACPVCSQNFDTGDHAPFVLACGHNVCAKFIEEAFSEVQNNE